MKYLIWGFALSLFVLGPATAEHTTSTKKQYIKGLPPFCCGFSDCKEADVRITRREGSFTYVWADGREWRVIGRYGTGVDGVFVAPTEKLFYCPIVPGIARCVLVRPGGSV